MTAAERARRTVAADALCLDAYQGCLGPAIGLDDGHTEGVALIAVGGYGRSELAPYSDLDVVLVHDRAGLGAPPGALGVADNGSLTDSVLGLADDVALAELAEKLWYPLWDGATKLDHAVRSFAEMIEAAENDLRVALGLLDIRHLAGDPNLTLRLRTQMLAQWRRDAKAQLPQLQAMVRQRHQMVGELAHASIPDLKECEGGLRDAVVLKALVATWLVDVSHADLERCRLQLLDIRDVVHQAAGRATDRIAPEMWSEIARAMGYEDALAAQLRVRELGRRITHLSRLAWRRVRAAIDRPVSVSGPRRPHLRPVAPGIAISSEEVVLAAHTRPEDDPLLLLRAAAEAAERDIVLAPATAARLVRAGAWLPEPWPDEARDLMVRLLAAGRGLLAVWETLEETGALDRILPEWERIRLLPHSSVIHRFTVDRHVVETCIEAAALIRHAARPDILLVAALLHDIGKGGNGSHSAAGEPIARVVAERMGFDEYSVATVAALVRWHLLLSETAATRDPDDPTTVAMVMERVGSLDTLMLLRTLTEADARATGTQAWTTWRASLVDQLVRRVARVIEAPHRTPPERTDPVVQISGELVGPGGPQPGAARPHIGAALPARNFSVEVALVGDGARVTVVAPDRIGLLADVAGTLALQRCSVRSARAWSQGRWGVSQWEVDDTHLEPAILRQRFESIVAGRVSPAQRLHRPNAAALAPAVLVRPEASTAATVVEVRAVNRPGILYFVCAALADLNLSVRSAHVSTVGPQAVDIFYVQEPGAGALADERAAAAAHAIRDALSEPAAPGEGGPSGDDH
ncbi:MAG: [protein-PII] uridylyltransferase [Nocardioides sp.]